MGRYTTDWNIEAAIEKLPESLCGIIFSTLAPAM